MKRGKEDILDECLERLLVNGQTVEQCLQSYPELSTELEPLLRTVLAARKASVIRPCPEFKARARYQFHRALEELKPKRRLWAWDWQPRWVTAVAIILVLVLAGGGTMMAAHDSMPGHLLHPVRLATEEVRLALTPSAIGKAELHAELADKRVAEIIYLAKREDKAAKVVQVVQRLEHHLTTITDLALAEAVTKMDHFEVEEKVQVPVELTAPAVPPPAQVEGEAATHLGARYKVDEAEPLAPNIVPTAKEMVLLEADRWARLKITLQYQAVDHLADLRNLLPVAPESAIPALLEAIVIAEASYERALRVLE
ncbi:MAG: DUF5667 domain-containing protein [Dehalococcoidia bacterium]